MPNNWCAHLFTLFVSVLYRIIPQEPIPTSITRLNTEMQSKAIRMFQEVLRFMRVIEPIPVTPRSSDVSDSLDGGSLADNDEVTASVTSLSRILKASLRRPELRDELYAQLHKQTRNNDDR